MTRIDAPVPVQPAATPKQQMATPELSVGKVAAQLAAAAPVDFERVQEIRRAIEQGTFPLNPARVADQLIALRYDWMRDDAA